MAEIRFPQEAIYGAAELVAEITGCRNGLRIDTIFRDPSTILYRSRALGRAECQPSNSPPRCGRQRPPVGVYSDEDGVLIAAIARHLG